MSDKKRDDQKDWLRLLMFKMIGFYVFIMSVYEFSLKEGYQSYEEIYLFSDERIFNVRCGYGKWC